MNNSSNLMSKELRTLKNSDLDLRIKSLARQERELLTQVLHVIKEIDNRRLYLELSFSSLFAYLTEAVGYSASSAQRRIDAARLLSEIPSLSEKIESGEIHLTQACMIQKAAREIKRTRQLRVSSEDKLELLASLSGKNQRDTEKQVAQYFDMPILQKSIEKAQADDSVRLEITLSKSQYDKLKQAQALVSHAVPSNQIVDFIEYVSDKVIKQKTTATVASAKKNGKDAKSHNYNVEVNSTEQINSVDLAKSTVQKKPTTQASSIDKVSSTTQASPTTQISSTDKLSSTTQLNSTTQTNLLLLANRTQNGFSTQIKKKMLNQFSSCQYRDPKSGKLCGSTWFLQVDHKHSRWAGGNNGIENATVLCSRHNNLKYRKEAQLK
jgi:hypothetical protein